MTQMQELREGDPVVRSRRLTPSWRRRTGEVVDDQMQELKDIAQGIRRRWWIPTVLAIVGAGAGVVAGTQVPPVYRAEATVLVGPTDGSVTHSSTVRTSEDLAAFYADMARREIVLRPVDEELRLRGQWYDLRNRVSAVVPAQNPRLVTVTVMGANQKKTEDAANAIVDRLARLSPGRPGGNEQQFVNQQAFNLQATIHDAQKRIGDLKDEASLVANPAKRRDLQREIAQREALVVEWQKNYVELITAEPTSDAGGLQVIDEATPVTGMGRSGLAKQAVIGGGVGGILGLVIAWLLHGLTSRREQGKPASQLSSADRPGAPPSRPRSPAHQPTVRGVDAGAAASPLLNGSQRRTESPVPSPGPARGPRADEGPDRHSRRNRGAGDDNRG